MSGPLGSSQWMYSSGFYPYEIEQSLRLNDDDSAYLSRTPASAGNRKTWTWSGWVKRGNLGGVTLFAASNASTTQFYIQMQASGSLVVDDWNGSTQLRKITNAVFRDPSAWYHVVVALDTTQATASDRAKIYVNGEQITSFSSSTDPSLNYDGAVNTTAPHALGREEYADTAYFDGYMAEINFIDGLALDPTSFGEFKSGVWIPKKYTGGSYGTNGFYLSFADSAAIGDDLSGNGNDWTPSGLASTDVLLDSPTENYATLNPLDSFASGLSEGNLKFANGAGAGYKGISTFVIDDIADTQKYYVEYVSDVAYLTGIVTTANSGSNSNTNYTDIRAYYSNGNKYAGTTATAYGASFTASDQLAMLVGDGQIEFFKNNVSQGVAFSGLTGSWKVATVAFGPAGQGVVFNFGQAPFAYAVPTGATTLNTANLPDPVIDPAQDDVPADYFNTVLYTGNGLTQSITGVGFQPDWTWIKGRSGATDHALYDAVRGVQEQLESNQTGAETTEATGLTAVGADGFSVGALAQLNTITATYVAWNWKAAGAGVANTDGTISSTVSANQKAGFSIVSYTGTGANATVGHGLGAVPAMAIIKNRDQADAWQVYHGANTAAPETDYLVLNTTAATVDAADRWNDTAPTSSVFSIGTGAEVNTSTEDYIAYCFAEVEGYSKFGSYTGNGSTDGPFCWNGFKPALIMVKRTDTTSNWTILDDAREGYNVDNDPLYPNLSNAEGTTDLADLLSNGFKLRTTDASVNASGGTYIYAAFASMPFKFSNAR